MVSPCPGTSGPKPTSPTFFTYDGTDILSFMPPVAGALTIELLGLTNAPVNTADFCSHPPPDEMPTSADFALLAFPLLAWPAGTFERFGNFVRRSKWQDLCTCTSGDPTYACIASDWAMAPDNAAWSSVTIPAGTTEVRVAGGHGGNVQYAQITSGYGNWDFLTGSLDTRTVAPDLYIQIPSTGPHAFMMIRVNSFRPSEVQVCGNFAYPPPTAVPPLADPPTGWTGPSVGTPTNAELLQLLRTIETEVRWIAAQTAPVEYLPGDEHLDLESGGTLSVDQVAGLIVTIDSAPSWLAIDPGDPPTAWRYGFVTLGTPDGWVERIPIRETPQVILNIHPQVDHVGYTFVDGVHASIRELRRGK